MRIKEVIERNCCEDKDLKIVEGSVVVQSRANIMFCIYCGHRHVIKSLVDAAGYCDWEYVKVKEAWEDN